MPIGLLNHSTDINAVFSNRVIRDSKSENDKDFRAKLSRVANYNTNITSTVSYPGLVPSEAS